MATSKTKIQVHVVYTTERGEQKRLVVVKAGSAKEGPLPGGLEAELDVAREGDEGHAVARVVRDQLGKQVESFIEKVTLLEKKSGSAGIMGMPGSSGSSSYVVNLGTLTDDQERDLFDKAKIAPASSDALLLMQSLDPAVPATHQCIGERLKERIDAGEIRDENNLPVDQARFWDANDRVMANPAHATGGGGSKKIADHLSRPFEPLPFLFEFEKCEQIARQAIWLARDECAKSWYTPADRESLKQLLEGSAQMSPLSFQGPLGGAQARSRLIGLAPEQARKIAEAALKRFLSDKPKFQKLIQKQPIDVRRHLFRALEYKEKMLNHSIEFLPKPIDEDTPLDVKEKTDKQGERFKAWLEGKVQEDALERRRRKLRWNEHDGPFMPGRRPIFQKAAQYSRTRRAVKTGLAVQALNDMFKDASTSQNPYNIEVLMRFLTIILIMFINLINQAHRNGEQWQAGGEWWDVGRTMPGPDATPSEWANYSLSNPKKPKFAQLAMRLMESALRKGEDGEYVVDFRQAKLDVDSGNPIHRRSGDIFVAAAALGKMRGFDFKPPQGMGAFSAEVDKTVEFLRRSKQKQFAKMRNPRTGNALARGDRRPADSRSIAGKGRGHASLRVPPSSPVPAPVPAHAALRVPPAPPTAGHATLRVPPSSPARAHATLRVLAAPPDESGSLPLDAAPAVSRATLRHPLPDTAAPVRGTGRLVVDDEEAAETDLESFLDDDDSTYLRGRRPGDRT